MEAKALAWDFLLAQGEVPGATLADYLDAAWCYGREYAREDRMLWTDYVSDEMQREQAQAEYVECPVCYGRGELPLGDGTDETDCFLCCGHGRVPATQAEAFEVALAKGIGL